MNINTAPIGQADDARLLIARAQEVFRCTSATRALRDAMGVLVDELPARTTLRQALAFVAVADGIAGGRAVQMRDLKEWSGEPATANTFDLFLDIPGGMGWISQEADTVDRRRKFLGLTPKGRAVVQAMNAAMTRAANIVSEEGANS